MQTVGTSLQTVLDARDRDLICLYELYESTYDPSSSGFDPRDAVEVFSSVKFTLPFGPVVYRQEVLQGPSVRKTTGKEFNSVSIRFSNVSRYMSDFVLNNAVEEMRLVVRVLSRSVASAIGNNATILSNSAVLFVGRCQKPDGFNRSTGTITAIPDLGTIAAQIPARVFQVHCPLDFKGPECLGTELLSEKSAAYQAAVICNKLKGGNCTDYANTEFFQGTDVIQITSSFVHKSNVSFWGKILNALTPLSRTIKTVSNSTHDGTPYGNPIPLIFGRWFKQLLALQYQDIGTSINFLMAACRGKISDFINIRNDSIGFTDALGITKHRGEYGGDGSQTADTVFPGGNFWSRLAYITGYVNGTDIRVEDPAPIISAVVAGIVPDSIYFDVDHDGTGKLAAGTGGVAAGGSSSIIGTPAVDFDTAIADRNPVSYYKLEDAAGPTMPDSSGNGVDGTYDALASFQEDGPIETDLVSFGVGGRVGKIDALVGSAMDLTETITINGFAYNAGELNTLVCRNGLSGLTLGNFLMANGDASLTVDGVTYSLFGGATTGQYHMYTLVRQGAEAWLYVDGCRADYRDDLPANEPLDFSAHRGRTTRQYWTIGYAGPSGGHVGEVWPGVKSSHVSFYNTAWSADDVADVWASAVLAPLGCPGEDWTDNPVDHARYILTEPSLMNHDNNSIDDVSSAYAAAWNCGAIRDDTNAERCLLADTETSRAGIDYKRYTSTGLLTPASFEASRTQIPAGVPAHEADYEFFDPDAPPTSLSTQIVYRKRYTSNVEASKPRKAVDFLYDTIFPTYRGFLRWNVKGQTVLDSERPADWSGLYLESLVGATELTVRDVLPWKTILGSPYLLQGKLHIDRQISYVYATATERLGASGFVAGDVGRYALQKDNNTIWQLTATTPTWTQITDLISEVRGVTAATYSALGDDITLASSASGGPTATASGANLTGGSTTVKSSGTITIGGSLTEGATITATINGVDCILDLVASETSATIGHRLACVINATPEVNGLIEAHATTNVVTVYAKIGVLTLSSALDHAHDVNTEVTRVMAAFAGKALDYSDATRANYLDGSFEWPDGSRQSLVNQIKTSYREAIRDFGEQPLLVNDYVHQGKTKKTNTFEIDLQAVDNYNTAARLANGYLNKFREGDFFFRWASAGSALLLDEGDVVCVSDLSGPFRNVLCRIEDIEIDQSLEVSFVARKYSRLQLSDAVAQPAGLLLPSATSFGLPPQDLSFNTVDFPPNGLEQATDGTAGITSIRGGLIFGDSPYAQCAKVRLVRRGGIVVDESINDQLVANSDLEGTFEFLASVEGLYTVEARACNQWDCSTVIAASIVVVFGSAFALSQEDGDPILQEDGDFIEVEH